MHSLNSGAAKHLAALVGIFFLFLLLSSSLPFLAPSLRLSSSFSLLRSLALRPVYEVSIVSIAHACLSFSDGYIRTYVRAFVRTLSMRARCTMHVRPGGTHGDYYATLRPMTRGRRHISVIGEGIVAISRARVNRYCVRYARGHRRLIAAKFARVRPRNLE